MSPYDKAAPFTQHLAKGKAGFADCLPDPEDVKERLRQMAARKRSEGSGS